MFARRNSEPKSNVFLIVHMKNVVFSMCLNIKRQREMKTQQKLLQMVMEDKLGSGIRVRFEKNSESVEIMNCFDMAIEAKKIERTSQK